MTSVNLTDIGVQDSEDPEGWHYKTIYIIEAVLIRASNRVIFFWTRVRRITGPKPTGPGPSPGPET